MSVNRKSELQLALEELGHDPMPDRDGRVSLRIDGDNQTVWNLAWDIARTNSQLDQDAPIIDNCVGSLILTWREDYFDEDETDDEEESEESEDEEDENTPEGVSDGTVAWIGLPGWRKPSANTNEADNDTDDLDCDGPDGSDEMGDEFS